MPKYSKSVFRAQLQLILEVGPHFPMIPRPHRASKFLALIFRSRATDVLKPPRIFSVVDVSFHVIKKRHTCPKAAKDDDDKQILITCTLKQTIIHTYGTNTSKKTIEHVLRYKGTFPFLNFLGFAISAGPPPPPPLPLTHPMMPEQVTITPTP